MRTEGRPLPETAERRPLATDGAPETNSPGTTITHPADTAALLELSRERDLWLRRLDAAWRGGWRACWAVAYTAGRRDEGAERDQAWHENAGFIAAQLDPDGPQAREMAQRRVRAAEAGCRRDAAEHWADFFQRAWATPPNKRNEVQRAAVALSRSWPRAGAA